VPHPLDLPDRVRRIPPQHVWRHHPTHMPLQTSLPQRLWGVGETVSKRGRLLRIELRGFFENRRQRLEGEVGYCDLHGWGLSKLADAGHQRRHSDSRPEQLPTDSSGTLYTHPARYAGPCCIGASSYAAELLPPEPGQETCVSVAKHGGLNLQAWPRACGHGAGVLHALHNANR
jgi:hypothetical protein